MTPERDRVTQPPSLPNFKLAEKLGQGAFGSVYKALNWTTGETCAVKQIDLSHIHKSELPDIMCEIDLLKALHHPNIVQYRGYARTDSALYIVLEYCENGSLSAIIKKFGRIPESLVGLYTLQVLQGLQYLHDQGVIHRDIKGSNILATKEGSIKLADFGVATRVGGPADSAVVGSPYWMAPEIVDQTGASTASDIWSLGALVIELLTSKPPYHFLDPMPALFRIVNDDCPPLPEGASAVVRDFLLQCFQKDVNLRIGARKLLRHPWMVAAKRQMDQQRGGGGGGGRAQAERPSSMYDDTVQKVQEWNEALRAAPAALSRSNRLSRAANVNDENLPRRLPSSSSSSSAPTASIPSTSSLTRRPSAELASALKPGPLHPLAPSSDGPALPLTAGRRPSLSNVLPLTVIQPDPTPLHAVAEEYSADSGSESGGDNWDRDFEEGISVSKIAALEPPSSSGFGGGDDLGSGRGEEDEAEEENSSTIRPPRKPFASTSSRGKTLRPSTRLVPPSGTTAPPTKTSSLPLAPVLEDYSDLLPSPSPSSPTATSAAAEAEDVFTTRLAQFKQKAASKKQLLRPEDFDPSSASFGKAAGQIKAIASEREGLARYSELEGEEDDYSDLFGEKEKVSGTPRTVRVSSGGGGGGARGEGGWEEDFEDGFEVEGEDLRLNTRLSSRSWLGDEDSDEDDPFADLDLSTSTSLLSPSRSGFSSPTSPSFPHDLTANLARDKLAQQCALVTELIETIGAAERLDGESEVREAGLGLTSLIETSPDARTQFVKSHGMLVVLEALRVARSREILSILLRIVNLIVGADGQMLEKIALVGGCPVVMAFSSKRYSREIRLEAALFIGSMCRTSLLTLQMFVSCQGLRTLVEMLDESYNDCKDLVWMAVDGISRVFEMNGPTPRNDFCRILTQEGLLEPLSAALLNVCGDDDDLADSAKAKIVNVLLLFAQSDHKVKEAMARRTTVIRLVRAASRLEPSLLAVLLKTIKNLSMLPAALEVLQNAGAIEMVVEILGRTYRGKLAAEIQNHAVNTLFNLCRLSSERQSEAAAAGAIPLLQRIVRDNSPLKQFALPILCDFAHAGKATRKLLWHHDGLAFYLVLLRDTFWVNYALEAILAWLQDDPARVEECLLEPSAIEALVDLFCKTKSTVFDNFLDPLHKLLRTSPHLSSRLAVQSGFLKRIISRLELSSKPFVRLTLLRITKTLFDALTERRERDKAVKVLTSGGIVARLAEEDKAVLSRQLAKSLSEEFRRTKEEAKRSLERRAGVGVVAALGGGGGGAGARPSHSRRAASESGFPLVALEGAGGRGEATPARRLRASGAITGGRPASPASAYPSISSTSSSSIAASSSRRRPPLPPSFGPPSTSSNSSNRKTTQ